MTAAWDSVARNRRRQAARRALAGLALALALCALSPAAAPAATVSVSGTVVTYQSAPGETDCVFVTYSTRDYLYEFRPTCVSAPPLVAGAGCVQVDNKTATCADPGPAGDLTAVTMNFDDGNDFGSGVVMPDPLTLNGGSGDDRLVLNDIDRSSASGGDGNDELFGGAGDDALDGGAGNDRLAGSAGADDYVGGSGIDRALYDDHRAAVTVDIDNAPDDGNASDENGVAPPGAKRDDVRDTVESIAGSSGADTLTGSCANNTLAPMDGDDTVNGDPATGCLVPGNDFMGGYSGTGAFNGDDIFNGQGGTDAVTYTQNSAGQPIFVTLDGAANDSDGLGGTAENVGSDVETLYGGAGDDTLDARAAQQGVSLFGRNGNDVIFGTPFNDLLAGETGVDRLDCGVGLSDQHRSGETVSNCEMLVP